MSANNKVNANPTKEFFIEMLTRDIKLEKAISELVDNSVDGATSFRKSKNFKGLWINLEVSEDRFVISDNCGGMSIKVAENYAFRFGRPKNIIGVDYSVGRFGVGMKRALFKLGSFFDIESKTKNNSFSLEIDVDKWANDLEKDWSFQFKTRKENQTNSDDEIGTIIEVTQLHDGVAAQFGNDQFLSVLVRELESRNEINIRRGLKITVNGQKLQYSPSKLLISDNIKPAYRSFSFGDVEVNVYAGLGEPAPARAGWYVYCNDRLIIDADKSVITGWGDAMPQYHNNFARFRGYVFFESKDPTLLPWNTTKTGIDTENQVFRSTKIEMIAMMKSVIDVLNKMSKEKESEDELSQYELEINNGEYKEIQSIKVVPLLKQITFPKIVKVKKSASTKKISFSKPISEIERVQSVLGVKTLKEVGELTFEYFLEQEC